MRHFPIMLDLQGARALVLGQGDMAQREAAMLREAGADVRMDFRFAPALLEGCALAIGVDAPEAELVALSLAARAARIPVNIAGRPDLCSFTRPPRDPVPFVWPAETVFLVGAGPGDAELLTLRARHLLGEADVILHDRLIGGSVLSLARPDAERVFVGKARANHRMPQDEINALLIRLARAGRRVLRLKGGDPFIFGRGGEEVEALARAGIAVEIVPGVTAALACAAQMGIPLTHRDVARSVTFVTGHTQDGRLDLDFATLAQSRATLAVYMGIASLPQLRDGLLAEGFDPATPAILIERGGSPALRSLRGTLDRLVAEAPAWSSGGPTLTLIGAVVGRGVAREAEAVAA